MFCTLHLYLHKYNEHYTLARTVNKLHYEMYTYKSYISYTYNIGLSICNVELQMHETSSY